jgi:protein-L-isoaspartate(D-aspartate) O-methyltransferase
VVRARAAAHARTRARRTVDGRALVRYAPADMAVSDTPREGQDDPFAALRAAMVAEQIAARGVKDPRVLAAMSRVPRHVFVPEPSRELAYADRPLPIGHEQTISQPYIVAVMCELAALTPSSRVLEVGTGCGYQTAVLAELAREVCSIEIIEHLARSARIELAQLGYENVQLRVGDGYQGWPEAAPFDAIVVAAAPPTIPVPLVEQLAMDGKLVIPIGDVSQQLCVLTRTPAGLERRILFPVRFVPMTGIAQEV